MQREVCLRPGLSPLLLPDEPSSSVFDLSSCDHPLKMPRSLCASVDASMLLCPHGGFRVRSAVCCQTNQAQRVRCSALLVSPCGRNSSQHHPAGMQDPGLARECGHRVCTKTVSGSGGGRKPARAANSCESRKMSRRLPRVQTPDWRSVRNALNPGESSLRFRKM